MPSHLEANVPSFKTKESVPMITLNRLGHSDEPFQLNPDMIVTVESTPDTVITLATGAKVVVAETPSDVAAEVHAYRADVLSEAFRRRRVPTPDTLTPTPATPTPIHGDPPRLSAVEDKPL
jgi:uncharacterized protein YlzI (FlbEa/FlbD family)